MADFVCLGDTTRDLFLFLKEAPTFNGSKIPVEDIAWSLGGNAANVAVGLTRLGLNTALVTVFGDDDRGAWIKKELMKNNVNLEFSQTEAGRQSNLSAILVAAGERTIFSYHSTGQKQVEDIPQAKWLYLTAAPDRDSNDVFNLALSSSARLAFNPSQADLKKKDLILGKVVDRAEVLILNKEEAAMLGRVGPKITVVTDGPNGAMVYEGEKVISRPVVGGRALEPTGAGDAFSSGFLAALFYEKDLETALEWGLRNSGSVIQHVGAIEGLLDKKAISI